MRQRVEIEAWRLADAADLQVRALVRTVRHLFRRQVRQARQERVDLLAQLGGLRRGRRLCLFAAFDLAQQRVDWLAARFCSPDLAGQAVAGGLCLLRCRLECPPLFVEREHLLGTGRQTAALEAAVEGVGVLPDPA